VSHKPCQWSRIVRDRNRRRFFRISAPLCVRPGPVSCRGLVPLTDLGVLMPNYRKALELAKRLVVIPVFVGIAVLVLMIIASIASESHFLSWTWWLYLIGGLVFFLLHLFGSRRRDGASPTTDATPPEETGLPETREKMLTMDEIRRRIRKRKASKD